MADTIANSAGLWVPGASAFTLSASPQQICPGDPDRWYLGIFWTGFGSAPLDIAVWPEIMDGVKTFIPLIGGMAEIEYRKHGSITQMAWYAIGGGSDVLTVLTNKWRG